MASTIYPYPNNGLDCEPTQVEKCLTVLGNTKAAYPNGYIIAKGNSIEGIKAKL